MAIDFIGVLEFIDENGTKIFLLCILAAVVLYINLKKWQKLKQEKEAKEEKKENGKNGYNKIKNFDTVMLDKEFIEVNHQQPTRLEHLRERRNKITEELNKNIGMYEKAKEKYEELAVLGKTLSGHIKTLQQEEKMYWEQIKRLEGE